MRHHRWGDDDRYFGPFTYAQDRKGWRPLSIMLGSGGDGDDDPVGCKLRLSGFGHTIITALPQLIRPWRQKVYPSWDAATVERLGRDWYWDVDKREYGFTLSEGHLSVHLGRQTHDSSTTKYWGCFIPWQAWRHVRHSLYDLKGELFADMPVFSRLGHHWTVRQAIEEACPAAAFAFDDYDGERITAVTRIEEREWLFGERWFKWLSLFRKPKIRRDLDIGFSAETGKRKGSWKGGTVGHSIEMKPGELHEATFRRYCGENAMTFVGDVDAPNERDRRQNQMFRFCIEAFTLEQSMSLPQRGIRHFEEATEAAQSAGTQRDMCHKMVDHVFDRPVGDLRQEIGGSSVTLLALAAAAGMSADQAEADEVARVLSKGADYFKGRNLAKNAAGFLAVQP